MKITAKSKFNYKTIKSFVRTSTFRKRDPLKQMLIYCLIAVLLIAVLCVEMYLLGVSKMPFILLLVAVAMLLLELYFYFVLPRIYYKRLGELKGCTNEFTFTDECIRMTSCDNGFSGETCIDYKVLNRVVETSKYFYIYQTKSHAFIVDKSTMQGGAAETLRQKLRPVFGEKYLIYKY